MSAPQPTPGQEDPLMCLMMASVGVVENSMTLEAATAKSVEGFSEAATNAVKAGNNILQADANALSGLSGDDLTQKYAQYQTDQTKVSAANQQTNALASAGSTQVNQMAQNQQTEMQYPQTIIDAASNQSQLVQSLGS